jgi:peptide/nickel transport system substrate-binding protein
MEVTKLYIIKWLPVLAVFSIMMVVACSSDEAAAPAPAPAAVAAPAPAPAPAAAPASKAPVQASSSGQASAPAADPSKAVAGGSGDSEPKFGGKLRYVVQGSIKYVDTMATGAIVTGTVGRHAYDQLFWRDKDYNIYGQMVSDWNMTPDGLTYTMTLRDGQTFHNGDALTAEDVMESHSRFARVDPLGRQLLAISPGNEGKASKDSSLSQTASGNTITMKFAKPTSMVLEFLAQLDPRQPSIMHKDIWSIKPGAPVKAVIGTGAYKMDLWIQGEKLEFSKFDGYVPNKGEEWDFTKGEITQYLDGFVALDIPDHSTRIAALQTNEVDVLDDFSIDLASNLDGVDGVTWASIRDGNMGVFAFNMNHGPFDMSPAGRLARRAIAAAAPNAKVMMAAVGGDDKWTECYMAIHCGTPWKSSITDLIQKEGIKTKGGNMKLGKSILAEAEVLQPGISEMQLRIIAANDMPFMPEAGLVMWEALRNLGFVNTELVSLDWGSRVAITGGEGPWEAATSWSNFANGLNPLAPHMFAGKSSSGYLDPRIDAVRDQFLVETDSKKAQAQFDEMNALFYDNPPSLNFFQFQPPRAIRDNVKGYCLNCLFPILHNVWLD